MFRKDSFIQRQEPSFANIQNISQLTMVVSCVFLICKTKGQS